MFSWIPSKLMCIHGLEAVNLFLRPQATAHIKCFTVLLARSPSYISIHQTLVYNTVKIKPSPSEHREHIAGKDAPVLLLPFCQSHSLHLALTRQVALNTFLAQAHLCVGNFSSHAYPYLPIIWHHHILNQAYHYLKLGGAPDWAVRCTLLTSLSPNYNLSSSAMGLFHLLYYSCLIQCCFHM